MMDEDMAYWFQQLQKGAKILLITESVDYEGDVVSHFSLDDDLILGQDAAYIPLWKLIQHPQIALELESKTTSETCERLVVRN